MGRKNLLEGLLHAPPPGTAAPEARAAGTGAGPAAALRHGAVGAVNRSLADLRARAVVELDPHAVEADGPQDRLEHDPQEDAGLAASIRAHGQQVPILVRPHPARADRWRIVYGRRRVLAARDLGIPVKALVRDLDDAAAVMAQGQENTHRRDLSFIEKANFARQLRDLGYDRKAISEAVNVDKTLLSRFLAVADRVPPEVVRAIGAAPGIGRDRWLALAELCAASGWDPEAMTALVAGAPGVEGRNASDARFEALFDALSRRPRPRPRRGAAPREVIRTPEGEAIATAARSDRGLTLAFPGAGAAGFADWLVEALPALHGRWRAEAGDADTE